MTLRVPKAQPLKRLPDVAARLAKARELVECTAGAKHGKAHALVCVACPLALVGLFFEVLSIVMMLAPDSRIASMLVAMCMGS